MLQAALHAETGLEQFQSSSRSFTASVLNNQTHAKPKGVEHIFIGRNSVVDSKMSDASICGDNVVAVSSTDGVKVAVDPATAFSLSQDDFDDDIDDLNFIDLPLHSELSHSSVSAVVTSHHQQAGAAASEKKHPSVCTDVISKNNHLRLPNNNASKRNYVNSTEPAQNKNQSFDTRDAITRVNGKYFLLVITLGPTYCA